MRRTLGLLIALVLAGAALALLVRDEPGVRASLTSPVRPSSTTT